MAAEIVARVPECFKRALDEGDLFFFPSTVHKHEESDVEFEIRLCPALQKKPPLPTPHFSPNGDASKSLHQPASASGDTGKQRFDPFAPPYVPNLHVGDLRDDAEGEEYAVLLNKYSVLAEHFLLVTKTFQSQSSPLLPPDLVQSYLLLTAAQKAGKPIFAFYNCGDNSGASQPHKHIQFIPVEGNGPPIEHLARAAQLETPDKPFSLTKLPYANHVVRLPPNTPTLPPAQLEPVLAQSFLALLDLCISTVRHDPAYPPGTPSYNVLLTREHMHVVPRRQEHHVLPGTGERIPVNALGYAGMLLVKSAEELEAVKAERVGEILRGTGVASVHELQVQGTAAEGLGDEP